MKIKKLSRCYYIKFLGSPNYIDDRLFSFLAFALNPDVPAHALASSGLRGIALPVYPCDRLKKRQRKFQVL